MNISEGQYCLDLPTHLTGRAKSQLTSMQNGFHAGESTFWTEVIRFFVRRNTTSNLIHDAVADLYNFKQLLIEDESEHSRRLSTDFLGCVNAHDGATIMTMFINGTNSTLFFFSEEHHRD